jgi:DNA-binding transcriptional regulator YhcF (GntR family)
MKPFELVIEQICTRIKKDSEYLIPSIRELCSEFVISYRTALKIMHMLRDRNIVSFKQGKKSQQILSTGIVNEIKASDILAKKIKEDIAEGTYRTGQPLPKTGYFVISQKVSITTVCNAFKLLQTESVIHKRGRSWIVGPDFTNQKDTHQNQNITESNPSVLIIVSDYEIWNFFASENLAPVCSEFCEELKRRNYDFILCQQDNQKASRRLLPTGKREILDCIKKLGNRYAGAFIASHIDIFPELEEWIDWLAQFKRNVVWLDHDGTAPHLDRRKIKRENYFRCYPDEPLAVRTALTELYTHGHRNVMIPVSHRYDHQGWFSRRIQLITQEAQGFRDLSIETFEQPEHIWLTNLTSLDDMMLHRIDLQRNKLLRHHPNASERLLSSEIKRVMRKDFTSFATIIDKKKHTALIGLNQWLAVNYRHWCMATDVKIPEDLSMISFDNILRFSPHPISTVDMQLEKSGYSAAHILIGDIPVKTNRWGNIVTYPQYFDRGSIGRVFR